MALVGSDFRAALKIGAILNEETVMLYRFDVPSYQDLKNNNLREHIDRVGKTVYTTEHQLSLKEPSHRF